MTRPRRQLRRWSAGEFVNSARRLNEPIDELEQIRETLGNHGLGYGHAPRFATMYVETVTPAGEDDGIIECEWASGSADGILVAMWPALYPSTGYTYTDTNTRQLTAGSVDEELVPELVVGEILRVEFFAHPDVNTGLPMWIDTNRVGRMWGEVL